MRKFPKVWLTTAAAASVLTVVFALLALALYTRTERGVIQIHSQDQQLLAQLAATALAQRLDNHLHSVELVAATLQEAPEKQWDRMLGQLQGVPPGSNLLLLHPDGTLSFREPPPNQAALSAAVLPWLGSRQAVGTDPVPLEGESRAIVLLVPLLSAGKVASQVGMTFAFGPLVETLLPDGGAARRLSLSLLNEQGLVSVNTRHPEMVGRRIPGPGGSCLPCHTSFALEQRMLAGEAGTDQLQVGRAPLALLAFTPVSVPGRRWSLSLSEPYSAVVADTRKGFRAISLLLGFSLLVGIVASAITLQYHAQRRRAEERVKLAERRAAMERQMLQTQQLASIGKMTSQIAHEINTPLAALGLNVSYLQAEVARHWGDTDPEIEEVSRAIAEEIDRLKRVVNDYLRFARLPQPTLAESSLREAVEVFLDFVEPEARTLGVQFKVELGRDPAYVLLDPDLFRQAFLNLVRNSFEAMPRGGTLHVRLERANNGEWILQVEDTGGGIPADVLPQIFDPFFTTKKEGTGLGLAHTRRVVEQHGGRIDCQSTPGTGTTFTIRLPVRAPAESENEPSLVEKGR
jgi:signal transduction histidine kinase